MAVKKSVGSLKEADLKGKRVFVRVDLNVPLDDSFKITDDTRIRAAVPTIKYLMQHGARVILASHLGRPKGVTPKYSLKPLVPRLSELLGVEVKMANDSIGPEVEKLVAELPEGGVVLLENVRFYKEEEKNDPEFAKKLASLADLYKDASTLQYITQVSQRTPLIPIKLLVHLGGRSLWVDCDKGFKSSTYKPGVCNSTQCTYSNSLSCGDCQLKPQRQPGCNNNSCYIWGENPLINWFDDSAEIADDVLFIGSSPGVRVTWPRFIFACFVTPNMVRLLANGVTGIAGFGHDSPISIPNQLALDSRFTSKFGICLSSSTTSTGVIFIGSGPYYVYNPTKIDISKDIVYTKLITNKRGFTVSEEYYIKVSSIRIVGKDVPLNKTLLVIHKKDGDGGTRISTSTPFTILHTSIYDALKSAFIKALPKNVNLVEPPTKQFELCFSSKNIKSTNVGPDVPVIDIVFHRPRAFWRIYGTNSVIQVSKDVMCLAFVRQDQTGEPSIVIGGHQLEENLLVFDLPKRNIGFSSSLKLQQTSCSKYDNVIIR